MRVLLAALLLALAGCAAPKPDAPAPNTLRWSFGTTTGSPPACIVRLWGPTANQDFVHRADNRSAFALYPVGQTVTQAARGRPLPAVGSTYGFDFATGRRDVGTVLQVTDERVVIEIESPTTLRAMLQELETASLAMARNANPAAPPAPVNAVARLDRCMEILTSTPGARPS